MEYMELKMEINIEQIKSEFRKCVEELIALAKPKRSEIFVVGCSTSEIIGSSIGKNPSSEIAEALVSVLMPILNEQGLYLAAQCCEHLNRALIIESEAAEKYNLEAVNVVPVPNAGGSFASKVYEMMEEPVAVEHIKASLGIDIGDTFIGMHLKDVAVPRRLSHKELGCAHLTAASCRKKYIGGQRARYK